MSYPEHDPFSEAAKQFNLDKLKRDLEEYGSEITDAPWMQFKGILCGHDEKEIAEKLNLGQGAIKGINVSLSRDITPKIKRLLGYPETKGKKRPSWEKVRKDLINKGYGIEAEIETIDWAEKCKEILIYKRKLAINLFTSDMGVTIELDQIHVPLGLIERKEKSKIAEEFETEKDLRIYQNFSEEATTKIPYSIFENEVLPEFKSSSNRIISILGEAGSGKTVQLLKIAKWILEQGDLPIFISLGSIPIKENIKEVKPLRDYLFDDWLKQFSCQVPNQWIKDLGFQLEQGKVWLLLDGADEIVGYSDSLGYLSKSLSIPLFQNAKVIITCRSNLWEIGANSLASLSNKTYKMMRFEYGDNNLETDTVSQFIDQWFKNRNPDIGKTLRQALDEPGKERIRDLVTHPLMLSLLCFSWQYLDGKLPDTKASLYKDFADAIYELKKGKFFVDKEDRFQLEEVLGKLALKSIEKGYKSILSYELVNEILEKPYPKLFESAINLHWLKKIGIQSNTRQPVYSFFHPSFQEYFAALAIHDWTFFLNHNNDNPNPFKKYNGKDCIYRVFDLNWQQVILMWLGIPNKEHKSLFIEKLFDFKDGLTGYFYQYQAQFLASLATAEYLHQYTNQLIEFLIERAFGNRWPNHPSSIIARNIILETDRTITLSKLIRFLNLNYDQCFLNGVIWSLQQIGIGSLDAISSLTNLILKYPNSDHADFAIESLGKIAIENEETIQLMLNILDNNNITCFEVKAAKTLVDICPDHKSIATNFLLSIIDNEKIAFVTRCIAAYSLFQIDQNYKQDSIKFLVTCCESSDFERWNKIFPKNEWLSYETIAHYLSKIDPNHSIIEKLIEKSNAYLDYLDSINYSDSIKELIQFMQNSSDISINIGICKKIENVGKGKDLAIKNLVEFIILNIDKHEKYFPACQTLTLLLETESQIKLTVKKLKEYSYNNQCYDVLWYCAQHLSYPEFYKAWYGDLPIKNNSDQQSLNQQKTEQFYLIALKTKSLNSIIEQKDLFKCFKNRLIDAIPSDIKPQIKRKIQESQDIADLEAVFIDLKELSQTENIALILGNDKPSQLLQEFCDQLNDFVQIDWNR